jgi:SAM-dependent methyltransferase
MAIDWGHPFDLLRSKWHEVPAGADTRLTTKELINLSDEKLIDLWQNARADATIGTSFTIRGWYHLLYSSVLRGKKVLDVGCGFGIDAITFAQAGAEVTFVDIVETNIYICEKLCKLFQLKNVNFLYMEDITSLAKLMYDYDVIWCQGSLINAPFHIIREEVQELLTHLPVGGRWIELAYPKIRWEREGMLPFDQWGKHTDGSATPYMEWYDMDKLMNLLVPCKFDTVLHFEFHNSDFNWFDLIRTG